MLRILFDEYMPGHDLILKIDLLVDFCKVGDSSYLSFFLEMENKKRVDIVLEYIEYLKSEIIEIGKGERFLAFDLSDEYIGGLFMKKGKKGLLSSSYAWTQKLQGYTVTRQNVDKSVDEFRSSFQTEREFLLSREHMMEGLNWSTDRIRFLTSR